MNIELPIARLRRLSNAPSAPRQVQRYIVPLSLSSPHLRLPLLSAAGAQSVFRGGAASTATARPFRAKRHLPRRSAPTLSSEATLAEAKPTLSTAAGAQSVFRGGAASTATARPFRAKRHLPRRSAPTLSSEATLAEAKPTLSTAAGATLFSVFFSFGTGNFKKLLYMIY